MKIEEFWSYVKRSSGCWDKKSYVAHRFAAWLMGMINSPRAPQNKQSAEHVLHKCDNRICCNSNHFFLGTYRDNQLDAYKKGRKKQPRGQYHSNAKLTNYQATIIRKRYAKGEYQTFLAKEYGVSQRVISLIVRGETYK